ncbi:MAG: N-acetylmuramoyl-L-alanine amidase [Blastocatellia bacterium]|nr:N-acetylmuramoyl-L-alanine amidase [Blastocatellia bacterium]
MKSVYLLVFLSLAVLTACRKETASQPATPTPTPATIPEQLPQLRTSDARVDLTTPLPTATQQDTAFTARGVTIAAEKQTATFISQTLPVTIAAPTPFLALSAKWTSVISKDARFTLSVRASVNDQDWGAWQLSSLDGDPRTQAGLFFFPSESRFIQYRIEMERDAKHQAPFVQDLKFRFISPGATPQNEQAKLRPAQSLTRKQWHCPETSFKSKQQSARVTHLIVHHTATTNEVQDWPAVVRTIWNFHAVTNGWRDLGYHYLIDPQGVIYEGRAGGDKSAGIHFSCANTGTLGIAMVGNYLSTAPNGDALQSLEKLLATKCQQFNLDPLGAGFHASTGLKLPHIAGHLDANASKSHHVCAGTHCPGERLYSLLPEIRKAVRENVH